MMFELFLINYVYYTYVLLKLYLFLYLYSCRHTYKYV